MGSIEEEKLFEMVDDFNESEPSPAHFPTSSLYPSGFTSYQARLLVLQEVVKRVSASETQLLKDVMKNMRKNIIDGTYTTSSFKQLLVMKLKMDGYDASLCHTSWLTTIGCPAGDYEYIGVIGSDESKERQQLIVDIDFKSQFEVARPTACYKKLLASVPSVFVGDKHKLNKMLTLLCSAAKQSFRENDIHMPPWRSITFMQSKYYITSPTTKSAANSSSETNNNYWEPPKVIKAKNVSTKGPSGLSCQFSTNITTTYMLLEKTIVTRV